MSWKVVELVYDYPHLDAIENSVLVCYATYCDDGGNNCFPSNATVEQRTKLSEPSVRRAKARLKAKGLLVRVGVHPTHKTEVYRINVEMLASHTNPVCETPRLPDPPSARPPVCETPVCETLTPVCETLTPVSQTPNPSLTTNKPLSLSQSARENEDVENLQAIPGPAWDALPGVPFPENLRTWEFKTLWESWAKCRADDGRGLNLWNTQQSLAELSKHGLERATVIVSRALANGFRNLRFEVADELENKSKAVPSDPAAMRKEAEQIMRQSVESDVPEINLALLEGYGRMQDYRLSQFGKQPRTAADLVAEIGRYVDAWGDLPASMVAETAEWFSRSDKPFPPPGPFAQKGCELWAKSRPAFTVTPVPTEYEQERKRRAEERRASTRRSYDPKALSDAKRVTEVG